MAQRIMALEMIGDEVRAATAERSWSNFSFLGAFYAEREADEGDLAPAINRILEEAGRPDIVLSAFPGELVAKRLLTLPFHDHKRLLQAVPFALEDHLPFGVEEAVVSYAPVARQDKNTLVLAAMVRKQDLAAHLELLSRAGLDPKQVTLSAFALSMLVRRKRNGSEPSAHLLVNLEYGRTSAAIIDGQGIPRALRMLPLGFDNSAVLDGRGSAVVAMLRQTVLAESGEAPPADLILSGSAASSAQVRSFLAQELTLPVRSIDEFEPAILTAGANRAGHGSIAMAGCCAMLLGEAPTDPLPLINFRVGGFAFHGRTGDLAPLYSSAVLAAVLVLFMIVDFSANLVSNYRHLWLLDQQTVLAAAPVLTDVPANRIEATLARRITEAHQRLRLLGGSGNVGSPLDTLLSLSRALPSRLSLDIDELTIDETGLRISGRADSYATIDTIKRAISTAQSIGNVQVTDEKPDTDHKVEFHLTAAVRDSLLGGD
jgi:hypothetical protein